MAKKRLFLEQAVQDANLRGSDIAKALKITPGRWSQIMGGADMKESQIKEVAMMLKVSTDEIVFDTDRPPEADQEFISLYRQLDPKAKVIVMQLMRYMAECARSDE